MHFIHQCPALATPESLNPPKHRSAFYFLARLTSGICVAPKGAVFYVKYSNAKKKELYPKLTHLPLCFSLSHAVSFKGVTWPSSSLCALQRCMPR